MSKEEIEELAQSLKNSGLAASIEDARKRAEEMLNKKNKGQNIKVGEKPEEQKKEVKEEETEEVEEPKEEKQEELFVTKEVEEEAKKEPEKPEADLTKFFYSGSK